MKALVIQHEESTPPGSTTDWLTQQAIPFDIVFADKIKSYECILDYDWLFICGGSMNVDQEDLFPWLKDEKDLIRLFLKSEKKITALCLGAQLLAECLGASVGPEPHWENGWHKITLQNTLSSLMAFHWHKYGFTLPRNAKLLASSAACTNQGFTLGPNIVAYQFHPETTVAWALDCSNSPRIPPKDTFVQTPEEIRNGISLYQEKLQNWYFSQLDSQYSG